MTQEEIKAKQIEIRKRLKEHDTARKIIEADLVYLHHVCEHPNAKTDSYNDRSGSWCTDWECPDCGKSKSS